MSDGRDTLYSYVATEKDHTVGKRGNRDVIDKDDNESVLRSIQKEKIGIFFLSCNIRIKHISAS